MSRQPPRSFFGPPLYRRSRRWRNAGRGRRRGSWKVRLVLAAVVALVALLSYFSLSDVNPYTGQKQRIAITEQDEVQLGLAAVPELTAQFGGRSGDAEAQAHVEQVGARLVRAVEQFHDKSDHPYRFTFTLLADPQTVNAFALPGGPMFITEALYGRLDTEGQLAGVMGHELGHVIHRHGAERMAQQQLSQGLSGAAVIASGDYTGGQAAAMVANFIQMGYGREDELESDGYGLALMAAAGYDPRSMVRVMEVLQEASGGSGGGQPEWASTHPHPENRVEQIQQTIQEMFPNGVPEELEP